MVNCRRTPAPETYPRLRVLRGNQTLRTLGGSIPWQNARTIDGPFPALAEAGMLCVGRSSDFRGRSHMPSRRHSGVKSRNRMRQWRGDCGTASYPKSSVTAAGPSRNRTGFPVCRPLPQERPTTNAQSNNWHCRVRRNDCQAVLQTPYLCMRASTPSTSAATTMSSAHSSHIRNCSLSIGVSSSRTMFRTNALGFASNCRHEYFLALRKSVQAGLPRHLPRLRPFLG